ncbi:MAG: hypothetical protein KJO69_00365 [Gammaproteobacteria bacterium]|nr:hypothetical protein [Gammaproteobacteria bacterium]
MDALSQLYLDINGLSKHLGENTEGLNERNIGAGLTLEKRKLGSDFVKSLTAGGYKNSFNKNSYYAGGGLARRINLLDKLYADVGGVAGVVSGYEDKLSPLAMPMLGVGVEDLWKLRLMYAPETDKNEALFLMNLGIPIK